MQSITQVPSTAQLYRAASVYREEVLFWPAASAPQLWQEDSYTVRFGLMHRVTFHCSTQKHVASSWLAHTSPPLNALQQPRSLPSALHQSQYLSLHHGKQTEHLVSQPFRSGCCHELWLASSLAERLPTLLHPSCPLGCSSDWCLLAQLLIEFRFQKPWVWVILH